MMKKNILLFLLLILCGRGLYSQTMSVESFVQVQQDLDARVNHVVYDQNGEKCALIKIETIEKGFVFDIGQLGVKEVLEDKVAEIWVYIPQRAMRIHIQHPNLGHLEYEFPLVIREATVYRLKLTSSKVRTIIEETAGGQYLVLHTSPKEVEIQIDNQVPMPIENGEHSIFLPTGQHTCTVKSQHYHSQTFSFTAVDGQETQNKHVELQANYGYLEINSNVKAVVEIDGISVGETPLTTAPLTLGTHSLRVTSAGYSTYEQQFVLAEGRQTKTYDVNLIPYFSIVTIQTKNADEEIFLNDEYKGTGTWQGKLMPATYLVKCERKGHRPTIKQLVVAANTPQSIILEAPSPMYGKIRVESNPIAAEVWLDGKFLGKTPNIFSEVLAGEGEIVLRKDGYLDETQIVNIQEGKIAQANVFLQKNKVTTGALQVNAVQDDVKVWSAGKFLGYAGTVITGLSPNIKYVTLSKSGYESTVREVNIIAGKMDVIYVSMEEIAVETKTVEEKSPLPTTILLNGHLNMGPETLSLSGIVAGDITMRMAGAMIGGVKRNGLYFKYLYESNIPIESLTTEEWLSEGSHIVTAGYLLRVSGRKSANENCGLFLYTGLGYGNFLTDNVSDNESYYQKDVDSRITELVFDCGVIIQLLGIDVSLGASYFSEWTFECGCGIMI